MTASTFLQIVNKVLVRLRESTVASFSTTDYSTMIANLVNQVKSEIENAWYWNALRGSYSVSAVSPTTQYSLTGTGTDAVILDAWNRTFGNEITKGTNAEFNANFLGTPLSVSLPTTIVSEYLQTGLDANYDIKVDVYPVPSSAQTLVFNCYVPQADLALDGTIPLVPQNVLIEETIARAMLERGDQGAQQPDPNSPGGKFIRTDLLAVAVSRDGGADPTEFDWEVE